MAKKTDRPKGGQKSSIFDWSRQREIQNVQSVTSFQYHLWENCRNSSNKVEENGQVNCRGIFGLRYTTDGKLLGAACEGNALVFVDPLTGETVIKKKNVHRKRCNTITFLDSRLFATCSDDCTIAVWDLRNLKSYTMLLRGHGNWVKNVEFHKPTGCLLSSGFDNTIRLWNLNKPTEKSCENEALFYTQVMRMRLSNNGESMYLTFLDEIDCAGIHHLNVEDISFFRSRARREFSEDYSISEDSASSVVCTSLFCHPDNLAVVLRSDCMEDGSTVTSVVNTAEFTLLNNRDKVLERGCPTNTLVNTSRSLNYIQEACFSHCGRFIASPLGYGVQILSYDKKASDYRTHIENRLLLNDQKLRLKQNTVTKRIKLTPELSDDGREIVKLLPKPLHEITCCFGHEGTVLSTAFSPTHTQIATGSINGQILLHEPRF